MQKLKFNKLKESKQQFLVAIVFVSAIEIKQEKINKMCICVRAVIRNGGNASMWH